MISSNDLRPGITIELDGSVWQCVEFLHVKPGKGAAFVRAKLKNMVNGSVVERKFNAGIKLQPAIVERKPMQYLYEADESYCFMDTETYEQIMLRKDQLGDKINFLKEEMECSVMFFNGDIIGIDIPNSVELNQGFAAIRRPAGQTLPSWKPDIPYPFHFLLMKGKCSVLIHVPATILNV